MSTTKEILQILQKGQEQQAKSQMKFASEVSIFINEQTDFNNQQDHINNKVLGFLENNDKTNEKGAMNRIGDLEKWKKSLEIKITAVALFIFASSFVIGFWDKIKNVKGH